MIFVVNKVPYTVEVCELLATSDPDDLGYFDTKAAKIQILREQALESAVLTLAHEVCHAWLEHNKMPRTVEAFCDVAEGLVVEFHDEFTKQGGRATLAAMMGVPFEGDEAALASADWQGMDPPTKRRFIIRNTICFKLSLAQFEVFMARCDASGLDPLRGDCWPAVTYDGDRKALCVEARTTIKAIRRIAQASPHWQHTTSQEFCAKDGPWTTVWTGEGYPFAARCGVKRTGSDEIMYTVCRWDDYAQFVDTRNGEELAHHWRVRGVVMIGKCAEAAAYARALPECDGIYLAEQTEGGRPTRHARAISKRTERINLATGEVREIALGEPKPEVYAAAPATRDPNARWIDVIARSAPASSPEQQAALLDEVREQAGCFEDENPEGFERALADEARRRFARRR